MPNLNDDFSVRVAVHASQSPWIESPMPGVERKMLDRIGDELRAPPPSFDMHRVATFPRTTMMAVKSSWCWKARFRTKPATSPQVLTFGIHRVPRTLPDPKRDA